MGIKIKKIQPKKLIMVYALPAVIVVAVFMLGIEVGNGNLHIGGQDSLNGKLPSKLNYSSVNAVYQQLKNNYDGKLTEAELLNGIKHGLADAPGDPYTNYFTPAEAKAFNSELNQSFSGIGAELSASTSTGYIEIIAPISGFPAAQAGIKAQDLVTSINGKSTSGMSIDDATDAIRGPQGTKVTLGILRNGAQQLTFTITRKNLVLPSVNTKILPGNVGYMQITSFANDTAGLAQKAANTFAQDKVKGIILDLRDDPGGLVTAADSVNSLWLNPGQTILQEKRGSKVISTDSASGGNVLKGIPTVVLINGGSASASEITAGSLHDHGDAYLIGEKSFGKGVVQQLIPLAGGAELKVTVASWYRPDGQNIEHKGITPDKTVKMSDSLDNTPKDTQLQAAESYLATK